MAADNNLDPYAQLDIEEMKKVGSNLNLDIIIEVDLSSIENSKNGIERAQVLNGSVQKITRFKEDYLSSPLRLKRFLKWSKQHYPSEKTMLVIWGHGYGWRGGFGWDNTSQNTISVQDLASSLSTIIPDIFLADACLMQSTEIITSLSPYTHFLVGTSQVQNYLGMPYEPLLNLLSQNNSTEAIVNTIPKLMRESISLSKSNTSSEMSMSVVSSNIWENYFLNEFKKRMGSTDLFIKNLISQGLLK